MGSYIPYVGRNWVIGGSEPKSFARAGQEAVQIEAKKRMAGPKPTRVTRSPIRAKYQTSCWCCLRAVPEGTFIHKARFPNGKERWVHVDCSVQGPEL
jgi:hypothetical protein